MNASWLKFLPIYIRTKLEGRHGLQAIIGNTGWLFADKVLRMGVGLVVGVWMARYLGPDQFGLWNFAIAFTALFGAFATLGLDGIVVRELVKNPERQHEILGSAFALKLIGGAIALSTTIFAISLVRNGETLTLYLVGLSATGFIFQSMNIIDFYFQAKIQSKYTVYASNGAFILMTMVKVSLLLTSAPLIAFAAVGLGEIILTAFFLMGVYQVKHRNILSWKYDGKLARELLQSSWPLIFSGLAVVIYMRIDQIMIGQLLGDRQVGLYSAAARISELWYFIPTAIVASVFPSIIEAKSYSETEYYKRLQKLFDLMVVLGFLIALPMSFMSNWCVTILYGDEYKDAANVLSIHIWSGVFVFLGVASSRWFIIENLQRYYLYRTLTGAILNIILNIILIPIYGISGAAWATLFSQAIASVFFNVFSGWTRRIFQMQMKSILFFGNLVNRN